MQSLFTVVAVALGLFQPSLVPAATQTEPARAKTPKVLLIGLDGLRSDALLKADAPNLHALIKDGCFTDRSHTGAPTVSGPGWSSVLCGVWHNKHGVKDNTFRGANYGQYPHIFTRMKEARPEIKVGSWVTWEEIEKYITPQTTDAHFYFNYKEQGDARNCDQICADIASRDFDVIFYYVSDIDETGHTHGFHPAIPQYMEAIKTADMQVGRVLSAIRTRPAYENENWLILVVPDHSGTIDGNHGRDELAHRRIFYIASGESAARGTIRDTVNQVDAVVTALAHLGIDPEPSWNLDGRVRGLKRTRGYGMNLVDNGDAEANEPTNTQDVNLGIPGWTDLGSMTSIAYGSVGGYPAADCPGPINRGRAFFAAGPVDSVMTQSIDLSEFASDIDAGLVTFNFSAWLGGYSDQRDLAQIDVTFYDENDGSLSAAELAPVTAQDRAEKFKATKEAATGFIERSTTGKVPAHTRRAEIRLQSLVGQGNADGYADNISLVLNSVK
jgi:hypothetical protein